MHPTRIISVHIQPLFAHCTSLIGDGFEVHLSTRRKVSSRSRKHSRSQGANVGRLVDVVRRVEGLIFKTELRTDAKSELSLLLNRTFLIERLVGRRSRAAAEVGMDDGDGFGTFSGVEGFVIDSSTR